MPCSQKALLTLTELQQWVSKASFTMLKCFSKMMKHYYRGYSPIHCKGVHSYFGRYANNRKDFATNILKAINDYTVPQFGISYEYICECVLIVGEVRRLQSHSLYYNFSASTFLKFYGIKYVQVYAVLANTTYKLLGKLNDHIYKYSHSTKIEVFSNSKLQRTYPHFPHQWICIFKLGTFMDLESTYIPSSCPEMRIQLRVNLSKQFYRAQLVRYQFPILLSFFPDVLRILIIEYFTHARILLN